MRWSVVIPSWNGRRLLAEVIDALARQTLADHEIVVADDASTDGSAGWLGEQHPGVRAVVLPRHRGFAAAANRGIEAARGRFVVLLNNDATPEPSWLAALDRAFEDHPEAGFLASKIVLHAQPHILHAAGDSFSRSGLPGNRGVWQADGPAYATGCEVFGACAAAAAYRRELLGAVGLFDEALEMYCEDVDLAWRAQLAGFKCRYVPEAVVRHRLGQTAGGPLASYLVARNRLLVVVANLPGAIWRRVWWRVLGAQLRLAFEALRSMRGEAARASLRGQVAGLLLLGRALRARRRRPVQRVSDAYIWSLLTDD
ncbi:MAG: glycosyltransferase family 2 protein [Actinobacteria bacterium]|nr:glycosyltransferase family 2 protein [Actinomycetota bacterium]